LFDDHLDRLVRSTFYAHGPERAYVIPNGNLDAFEECVGFACEVWNGAGGIILIATEDGTLLPSCERHVARRFLDEAWLHPALSEAAVRQLNERRDLPIRGWDEPLGFPDPHPVDLLNISPGNAEWQMTRPRFSAPGLAHVASATWGRISNSQRWSDYFDLGVVDDANAFMSLLGGQLGINSFSPLYVSQLSMRVFGQLGRSQPRPVLWIFEEEPSLEDLAQFWNLRSGADAKNRVASVIALPARALTEPVQLEAIGHWARATDTTLTPAVIVKADLDRHEQIEQVLKDLGIARHVEAIEQSDTGADQAPWPSWAPREPELSGPIVRGAFDTVDYQVRGGRAYLTLPKPRSLAWRGGARLVISDVPTPLPLTASMAREIFIGGYAHPRGLGVNMGTGSPWSIDLNLPSEIEALGFWAADHGYQPFEPPPGKDARALLQRLGRLDRLDVLIDEAQLEILVRLAPLAREQLVRRLAREFAPEGTVEQLANELRDRLRNEGLLVSASALTVEQLKSKLPGYSKPTIVEGLGALISAGFVLRGRNVRCPRCDFDEFLALAELDELIRCRGCGLPYLLPVAVANHTESPTAYRVDGLMARVLERHVLPVVLTLRALRSPKLAGQGLRHAWPGIIFSKEGQPDTDVDLLLSDGRRVLAAECKLDARSLELDQTEKLLAFATDVDAQPVIAALNGNFGEEVERRITDAGGLVLTRQDLLAVSQDAG
jgi:hypothetical protein